jgi:hypothetical protein
MFVSFHLAYLNAALYGGSNVSPAILVKLLEQRIRAQTKVKHHVPFQLFPSKAILFECWKWLRMPTEYFHQLRGSGLLEKALQQNVRDLAAVVFGAELRTGGKAAYQPISEVETGENPNHLPQFECQNRKRAFTFPVRLKEELGRSVSAWTISLAEEAPPLIF